MHLQKFLHTVFLNLQVTVEKILESIPQHTKAVRVYFQAAK